MYARRKLLLPGRFAMTSDNLLREPAFRLYAAADCRAPDDRQPWTITMIGEPS